MVTITQSAANWLNNAHSHGSHAFTHTRTSTQVQPLCVKRKLSYYIIWNRHLCEGTWRRGSKPEYSEKNPASLPANRYRTLLEEKIQRPGRESNLYPPTWVISSRGRARAASDPLGYRPPRMSTQLANRRLSMCVCVCVFALISLVFLLPLICVHLFLSPLFLSIVAIVMCLGLLL